MTCSRFEPEAYSLYAINVLDPPEAEAIGAHLAAGCETCNRGVREAAQFWFRFAAADAQQARESPSPAVRERLLEQVRASNVTPMPARKQPRYWMQAIAAGVALVMIGGAWYAGRRSIVAPAPVVVTTQAGEVAELRSEVERLRAQLRTPAPTAAPTLVPTAIVAPNDKPLRDALAEAQARLDAATQSLAAEQARARQLDQELQNQRALYAGALKEREQTKNSDATRLVEAQRQLNALTTRLETLERQNSEYRFTVARQQKELEQNLRMVSFLSSPSVRVVKLQATDKGGEAIGQVYVEEGQKLVFNAARLPALSAGRAYQLWVIRGHAPAIISAGVFSPDASGRGTVQFEDPSLLRDIRALAVTEEPKSGSAKPTGHKMLIGSSKS